VQLLAGLEGEGRALGEHDGSQRTADASGGGAVCSRRRLRMSEGAAARGVLVMACTGGGKV